MKELLNSLKRIWMHFARMLGRINTVVLLSVIYVAVIGVMALFAKLLNKDPLKKKIRPDQMSYWSARKSAVPTMNRNKFQF
jgi:hypothetical protein